MARYILALVVLVAVSLASLGDRHIVFAEATIDQLHDLNDVDEMDLLVRLQREVDEEENHGTDTSRDTKHSGKKLETWEIVLIVLGSVFGALIIIILIVLILWFLLRDKDSKFSTNTNRKENIDV
eukprot:TRINITY_DN73_c0_g1_i1.p1 TRINITY_DN73_c0_g1~~TRINITY_DN73_c0_g1_i1.p1  ORF type:complete len:125 (-),score=38.19 TRINITY_DN73_c0_g1_i1:194-568(-)